MPQCGLRIAAQGGIRITGTLSGLGDAAARGFSVFAGIDEGTLNTDRESGGIDQHDLSVRK